MRRTLKYKLTFSILFLSIVISVVIINLITKINKQAYVFNEEEKSHDYIKYVEFKVPYCALEKALNLDIDSHNQNTEIKFNWIEILSCLAAKKGGNFSCYKDSDIDEIIDDLKSGKSIQDITSKLKLYPYFFKAYSAILDQFVGNYSVEKNSGSNPDEKIMNEKYGLKVFSPIAKTFPFNHYADFGASRTYGYARPHLGHDLMSATGTPVIAIESGTVEVMGWNQYGGWRIGIRSFDKMRYYYYAHLRKDKPYHESLYENKVVKAGDVIGYVGKTGYSPHENVNNISTSHLHLGLELIFDESQKESNNEIWIDLYAITKLLQKNQCEVIRNPENKHYYRKYDFTEPILTK